MEREPPALFDTEEGRRLAADRDSGEWRRWGPYLSDRQWGTVREDYSADGDAWDYLPYDQARSRAYRWGEDAIGGFGQQRLHLNLGVALWNGQDPHLKERLFGLTNAQGNHGEDVKELYYYLDATPTHSYNRMLYKYPARAFPYRDLIDENARRGAGAPEYELLDTGIFDEDRYFDVEIEYAKAAPDDILMRVTITHRGAEPARLHVLPQLWARNIWSWKDGVERPVLAADAHAITVHSRLLAPMRLDIGQEAQLLFCDNDTNVNLLYGETQAGWFKDGINRHVVEGVADAVNPARTGTKAAAWHVLECAPGVPIVLRLRLHPQSPRLRDPFADFDAVFDRRIAEADAFYATIGRDVADADRRAVQRQALAGMLWSKQFYCYDVRLWLSGDPTEPPPPAGRGEIRNGAWTHVRAADIISMPDKWEYPWFASWDLALQCPVLASVDPEFAKQQLLLLTRDWYMHPDGALPAYEWSFSDANPPVFAWATWRVFEIDRMLTGRGDLDFVKRAFNKLILNFTWWLNRKDAQGRNLFEGGFLGLDNISIFDRSSPLPTGGSLSQSDGTAWMAVCAISLMHLAIELAQEDAAYEEMASKFFEHFLAIAAADGNALWDEEDGFFYDVLATPDGQRIPLRARTMVGLIPLLAVAVLPFEQIEKLPTFRANLSWFLSHRPDLATLVSHWEQLGTGERMKLSLLREHRLTRVLERMLDEREFLSDYGIRSVSRTHLDHPYRFEWAGKTYELPYWPGESENRLFGGNSNWRGPVWMPLNYLLIDSMRRLGEFYGDSFTIAFPTGSDRRLSLGEVALELAGRLTSIFTRGPDGRRPVHGTDLRAQTDPQFRDLVLFYEYFHGDTGRGVGASHQTGWTGLIALLIHQLGGR
ncbi:hypothetical protein FHR90_000972 [Endobacter medicaginis]|uniref:Glucosidase n=1 Tax=Endobacter medicaginis TaxID=1181271 RepID=A0A839UXS0_9PROT|nr:glucosidase [Endobacter medicaginis]MBB3173154.1 hypothetical protein [Endobacter medicaginis]MCX5476096.1 glucosidase [Endobacter medicaginis]NVN31217.1 glucosidase [Endobacter medicaginis]